MYITDQRVPLAKLKMIKLEAATSLHCNKVKKANLWWPAEVQWNERKILIEYAWIEGA